MSNTIPTSPEDFEARAAARLDGLLDDLQRSHDRRVAVVVSATIEAQLDGMLRAMLAPSAATETGRLLGSSGALGSLGAKTDLLVSLGVLSSELGRDIGRIARIRNRMAHAVGIDFDDASCRDLVTQLAKDLGLASYQPRLSKPECSAAHVRFGLCAAGVIMALETVIPTRASRKDPEAIYGYGKTSDDG